MSEWSIEHAWKSTLLKRADAHEIPPTHARSTTSRNIDTRRHVLLNHRIDRGFEGVCDTVLTQSGSALRRTHNKAYAAVPTRWPPGPESKAPFEAHRKRGHAS